MIDPIFLLEAAVNGVLLGGVLALLALGLNLIFGVVDIVWIEHIMATLMRVVDRIVVLDHGEKIAEGLPLEIAEHPQVVEAYLGEKIVLA